MSRRSPLLRVAVAALSVLTACAFAVELPKPDLPSPSREIEVEGVGKLAELRNGVRLFVVPTAHTGSIQFDVRHHVGDRDETDENRGVAHFAEHLMFQIGATGPGSVRVMDDLRAHALAFNAFTDLDRTHYMQTGRPQDLERFMQHAARRLQYDCEELGDAAFEREREVVRNEQRRRYGAAGASAARELFGLMYPKGHPYHAGPFANDQDMARLQPDDVCAFVRRHYVPDRTDVVITGAVDPLEALRLARQYLAPIRARDTTGRVPVVRPAPGGTRTELADVDLPTALVLVPAPRAHEPDAVAASLGLAAVIVALFTTVRVDEVELHLEDFDYWPYRGGAEAPFHVTKLVARDKESLEAAVDGIFRNLGAGFESRKVRRSFDEALESGKQRARIGVLADVARLGSSARAYADVLEVPEGRRRFHAAQVETIDQLDAQRIVAAARRYFTEDRATVVILEPSGKRAPSGRADFDYTPDENERLDVPDGVEAEGARRPLPDDGPVLPPRDRLEHRLDNGLRVYLLRTTDIPVFSAELIVGAGMAEVPQTPLVADLAATMFLSPANRLATARRRRFERSGSRYETNVGPRATWFRVRGLSTYVDHILAYLSQRTVYATYRGRIDDWRFTRRKQLRDDDVRARAQAENRIAEALFGVEHPFADLNTTDERDLRGLNRFTAGGFRRRYYRADNSVLVVKGKFDVEETLSYVQAFFGRRQSVYAQRWGRTSPDEPQAVPTPPRPSPTVFTRVDHDATQTSILSLYPVGSLSEAERATLEILVEMLDLQANRVRTDLGISYGGEAVFSRDPPAVVVAAAVDSVHVEQGVASLRSAVDTILERDDFERLFAFARRRVHRRTVAVQSDPHAFADVLVAALKEGRSYDDLRELPRVLANTSPGDVHGLAVRLLGPQRRVTIVDGPPGAVERARRVLSGERLEALPTLGNPRPQPKAEP